MKLASLRKMKLFRKKDKQKTGAGESPNGPRDASQHYLGYGSSDGPSFAVTDANGASSSLRGRNFKGLKGFGGSSSSGGGGGGSGNNARTGAANTATSTATGASARLLHGLPETVLARIFSFVCPHSQDRTYEKCEDSSLGEGCMLCDMRDLAHCVQVCRRWRPVAEMTLYTSVRIDTVHYCMREALLADKRKRRSFFDRNGEPEDTPDARLKLLCRTLRDDPTQRLGRCVQFLKIPYMLRESRHADIARTVSVLPNLRYVDLPEGLFMDEPVYITLKLELQAKCPDIRKMTYMIGAERSLEALASGNLWRNLEVLELVKIGMDPAMMRHVLGSLPNLRALKVTELETGPHAFADEVLAISASSSPSFGVGGAGRLNGGFLSNPPPLEELVLTGTRRLTSDGLLEYLGRADTGHTLKVLTLNGTGVKPWSLRTVLALAPYLRHLTVVDQVSVALPIAAGTKDIQPLSSSSLKTLNYEIAPAHGVSPYAGVTRSYYNYLSGSILSGGLPNLRAVYVRDAQFPELLLGDLPLPGPIGGAAFGGFGGGGGGGGGANNRRPASASASSVSETASALNSPMSTGSLGLGPAQSPMGFLSPNMSPGFPPPRAPALHNYKTSSSSPPSSNPFLDPHSPPPVSMNNISKPWAAGHNPRFSSNNPFAGMISPREVQTLEVFTKGDDDLDWSSIVVGGGGGGSGDTFHLGSGGGNGSSSRPVSSYGLGADLGAIGARKSVLVNMGTGSFLAVPDAGAAGSGSGSGSGGGGGGGTGHSSGQDLWPRPVSAGERRSEKMDLWR
ncbi:hypothetical protein SCUCBS95973_006137 [Sporothrix curviconia]|uniref:F-box domain-containing protein n=1 Tax=Sporothrix curviconia TaxID=1260050 RepID=A0ABP0C4Z3_9PEZI